MAKWVEAPDPASQPESRKEPWSGGSIYEDTVVPFPATPYKKLLKATSVAQSVFDTITMRMSHVFPGWKGTRYDFRFADSDGTPVFALTPKPKFICVEIRTDKTGYRDSLKLFPRILPPSFGYTGNWIRVNVRELAKAIEIADDVEKQLG